MTLRKLALSVISAFVALPAAAMTDAELKTVLERRLSGDLSGVCVAAAVIDGTAVARAYVCAAGGKPRVGDDTAFEIGSITKTMNGTLLAQFILAGKVSLDTPLAELLPKGTKVPQFGDTPILVRHVVTHTSGLPSLPPAFAPADLSDPYAKVDEGQLVASLADVKLARAPGTQFEYSNYATMLLSAALARLAGTDYETLLRERLFAPLAMKNAYVAKRPDGVRAAQGHMSNGRETPPWTLPGNLAGVGGVRATLADMIAYVKAELGLATSPVDAAIKLTHTKVETKAEPAMGINWIRVPLGARTVLMHDGGTGGFASFAGFDPDARRGVVVLADASIEGVSELGLHLIDATSPLGKPRAVAKADPKLVDALVGDYTMAGMKVALTRRGDALVVQAQGQPAFVLAHDSHGDFYTTEFDARLSPVKRADGSYGFAWHQLGATQMAQRVGAQSKPALVLTPAELAEYAGEYPLAPGFALTAFEKDGKLWVQGTGQQPIDVVATQKDTFAADIVAAVLRFERREGKVVALTLEQNGQKLRGERK
jgi:CubicO group peptidase (beta-lactamase class C family)